MIVDINENVSSVKTPDLEIADSVSARFSLNFSMCNANTGKKMGQHDVPIRKSLIEIG